MNFTQFKNPVSVIVILKMLKVGAPVAVPTETVYGLAAPISNETALRRIFEIKGRPADNPIIVHIGEMGQLTEVASIPDLLLATVEKLTTAFWPGPLTLVLPANRSVSSIVTAGLDTVAVRMPNHPVFLQILRELGEPLAAPSANPSGAPSPTRWEHVEADYQGTVAVVDGGECTVGIESTVILPTVNEIIVLRQGSISEQELREATNLPVRVGGSELEQGASPGTRHRHYAPRTPVRLVYSENELTDILKLHDNCAVLSSSTSVLHTIQLHLTQQSLYDVLRKADNLEVTEILVHCTDDVMGNTALMDRIRRASER